MNANLLFPSNFKRLGVFLIVMPFVLAMFFKILNIDFTVEIKEMIKILFQAIICLGLFFVIYSKYKDDDEMLYMIRLQITVHSLFLGIVYMIISPLADVFVFKDPVYPESAVKIIMFILIWQNLIFHYKRYQLKKELNNN